MTNTEPSTLSEAFPDYPGTHPQTLADLLAADPETISDPLAWFLRRQATEAVRASERHQVLSPKHALALLRKKYALRPWEGAWVSYALSADRQVVLVPDGKGGLKSLRKATRLLPKVDDLPPFPASAYRGGSKKPAWLVIFGGNPDVLEKEHVAAGLASLQRRAPIADICFYVSDPDNGVVPTLWSVRAGVGVASTGGPDGTEVAFPNPDKLQEVRT